MELSKPSTAEQHTTAQKAAGDAAPIAAILTALPEEFNAVVEHLNDAREETDSQSGAIYEIGTFQGQHHKWNVIVGETDQGNVDAALSTITLLSSHHPDIFLFVGIAGGLKDLKLGDVVAATKIYYVDRRKETASGTESRVDFGSITDRVLHRAKRTAIKNEWQQRIKSAKLQASQQSTAKVGPVVSVEGVIGTWKGPTGKKLKKDFTDALALAMEDFGFLRAILKASPHCERLVVRGISDHLDHKQLSDARGYQQQAAKAAAAFAFEVLYKFQLIGRSISTMPAESSLATRAEAINESTNIQNMQRMIATDHMSIWNELVKDIPEAKNFGYWMFTAFPTEQIPDLSNLKDVMRKSTIRSRYGDFPGDSMSNAGYFTGGFSSFYLSQSYRDGYRIRSKGLLVYEVLLREEFDPKFNVPYIEITWAIGTITRFYLLCRNLYSLILSESSHVQISTVLQARQNTYLATSNHHIDGAINPHNYVSRIENRLVNTQTVSVRHLKDDSLAIAALAIKEIFKYFGNDDDRTEGFIHAWQKRLKDNEEM